jgi:hypothetical protein
MILQEGSFVEQIVSKEATSGRNIAGAGIEQRRFVVLPDDRVDRKNAALYLGRSPVTLADWHRKGIGPRSHLVGGRRFYKLQDLRTFAGGVE